MADGLLNKASIILTPTGYKAGTLYNVAPVVEPYEDFDFARASVASRVNSSGLVEMVGRTLGSELIVNGDFATNLNGWTGNGVYDNGRARVDIVGGGFVYIGQNYAFVDGNTYKLTFNVNGTSGKQIKTQDNGSNTGGLTLANGTWTLNGSEQEFNVIWTANSNSNQLLFARNTNTGDWSFSIDNVSVKEIIDTNNIPRISYDSNGQNGHILLEPTSTNLVTYSEDFSQSSWINTYTLTPNSIISPDGSLNAYTITLPSVNGNLRTNVSVSSSTDYIFSFYAKRGTASEMKYRVFDFTNFSDIVSKTSYYSQTDINNWVRIEVPFTTNATTSEVGVYIDSDSQGNGDFYIWGAQVEELSYTTSYIPTLTGSTVTRATETATGAGSADLINSTEGVLYAEIAALANDGTNRIISISDGTTDNIVRFYYSSISNSITASIKSSENSHFIGTHTFSDVKDFIKVALSYEDNSFKLYVDGVLITTYTSGLAPLGLNKLDFTNAGGSVFYGKCKALAVFNEALSPDELTQLTT